MSYLSRIAPRATASIAHGLPSGSMVNVSEARFLATGTSSTMTNKSVRSASSSTLPGSQTAADKTNPNKTSADSTSSQTKGGPDKAHQSILQTPTGQLGVVAVTAISIYAAYKMLLGNSPNQQANLQDMQNRLTRPDLQPESAVHRKVAQENSLERPRETAA